MIYLNLIPSNLWYLNLRKLLTDSIWKSISDEIRNEQHYTCQFCGISIKQLKHKKYFHCHEMWDFNDEIFEVSLLCLVTLCSHCHLATHIGYASANNKYSFAYKQIKKVNKWDDESIKHYIEANFEKWSWRSNKKWSFNKESLINWIGEENTKLFFENLSKIKNKE